MISDAVNSKGYSIDKKEVNLSEPIKHIGNHFVQIKLGHSIEAKIKIKVQSEK
jgi:large subunit ribosomal protein L9